MVANSKKTYAVIRAVYDHSSSPADFERELDFFLTHKVGMIIIEPETLGEITWRWIRTGNWLHKTAVVCGVSALATASCCLLWNAKIASATRTLPLEFSLPSTPSGSFNRLPQLPDIPIIFLSVAPQLMRVSTTLLSAISASAAGFYALFWQWDPCCKYQVAGSLAALPRGLTAATPSNSNGERSPSSPSRINRSRSPVSSGEKPVSTQLPGPTTVSNDTNTNECNENGITPSGSDRSGRRPVVAENRLGGPPYGPPLRPVVLVHRDDGRRKLLHNTIAISSSVVAAYLLVRWSHKGGAA